MAEAPPIQNSLMGSHDRSVVISQRIALSTRNSIAFAMAYTPQLTLLSCCLTVILFVSHFLQIQPLKLRKVTADCSEVEHNSKPIRKSAFSH